ncbi:MAG: lipid-A-disaccharide synthase [Pseudorhodoplanes sp.]
MIPLPAGEARPAINVFLVVGEESGDHLGAGLMRALKTRLEGRVAFAGVGGQAMAAEGLTSLFPLSEIALFGFTAVLRRLPAVLRRIRETAAAAIAARPDVVVVIDSPDFTHRVAKRIRAARPDIPIVDYVSPSVWAWRPGRARAMHAYIDHVLALLPFEPDVHARLGGPPCTYVGHPLIARIEELRPNSEEVRRRALPPPVLLVLPGSRRSEIRHLLGIFGETIARLAKRVGPFELVLPTVPHLLAEVKAGVANWSPAPRIVVDHDKKRAAFRIAHTALAASGTVTLELALAGVPTIAAYRLSGAEAMILRRLIRVPSVILANLVLGEIIVPEFLQENCTAGNLADALAPLLRGGPARQRQIDAFARLDAIMQIGSVSPDLQAADVVIAAASKLRPKK